MLTLIAFSAALLQEPPAAPPAPEVRVRTVFLGGDADGPNGLDADGDGQVTREEFASPLNTAFARLDKDGDGRLSAEELSTDRAGGPGARVRVRQIEGDDVERFELRRAGPRGARFERDGDRTMVFVGPDGAEGEAHVVVRTLPPGGPRVIQFDHGPDGGPGRIEVRARGDRGEGLAHLDKDGDGKVSEAEFLAPLREAFARMDADHSGFVEEGERGDTRVHVFSHRIDTPDDE